MTRAVFLAALLLLPATALASSDDAWTDLDKRAKAACTAQIKSQDSELKIAGVAATVTGIGGNDNDQFYALVLKGQGKGYKSQFLCLYDKRTRKAQTSEVSEQ